MRDALYPALADKVSHELDVESETDIKSFMIIWNVSLADSSNS